MGVSYRSWFELRDDRDAGVSARATARRTGRAATRRAAAAGRRRRRRRTGRLGLARTDAVTVIVHMRGNRGVAHADSVRVRRVARRDVTDGGLLGAAGIARVQIRVQVDGAVVHVAGGQRRLAGVHGGIGWRIAPGDRAQTQAREQRNRRQPKVLSHGDLLTEKPCVQPEVRAWFTEDAAFSTITRAVSVGGTIDGTAPASPPSPGGTRGQGATDRQSR